MEQQGKGQFEGLTWIRESTYRRSSQVPETLTPGPWAACRKQLEFSLGNRCLLHEVLPESFIPPSCTGASPLCLLNPLLVATPQLGHDT